MPHVKSVRTVADHFERKIGFNARAHIKITSMIERPATMLTLDPAQIAGNFLFQSCVPWFSAIVSKQHVFGGNCCIGFKFKHPMPIALLAIEQCASRTLGQFVEAERLWRTLRFLHKHHAAAFSCWLTRSAAR